MFITIRRLGRAIRAACPKWLVFIWILAACIPTPFEVDELIPLVLTLIVLAVQWQRFPRGLSAWRGGKSHRAYDMKVSTS